MIDKIKRNISSTQFLTFVSKVGIISYNRNLIFFLFLFLPPIFTCWNWFSLASTCFILQKLFS